MKALCGSTSIPHAQHNEIGENALCCHPMPHELDGFREERNLRVTAMVRGPKTILLKILFSFLKGVGLISPQVTMIGPAKFFATLAKPSVLRAFCKNSRAFRSLAISFLAQARLTDDQLEARRRGIRQRLPDRAAAAATVLLWVSMSTTARSQ